MFTQNTKKRQRTLQFNSAGVMEFKKGSHGAYHSRADHKYTTGLATQIPDSSQSPSMAPSPNASFRTEDFYFRKRSRKDVPEPDEAGLASNTSSASQPISGSNPRVPFGRNTSLRTKPNLQVAETRIDSGAITIAKSITGPSTNVVAVLPRPQFSYTPVPFASLTAQRELSAEQLRAIDIVMNEKKNVFITGSAVLLANIISQLLNREDNSRGAVAITAPTGIAAFQIGGTTLHSWAGVGLGKEPVEKLISNIMVRREAKGRWMSAKVLIIDESKSAVA
ncbi:ATP-dependent DNA helicase pfh1 [Smittium mucronatum]|uniref:ATP-dependent DNA helicase n=1 Tax=Smittium mucronatum TaxID=133383 RepID=A0A1R0H1J1_9FUNG|nr:ATP-dependent DNA helicase pfh1 [Smittium mucronatum]